MTESTLNAHLATIKTRAHALHLATLATKRAVKFAAEADKAHRAVAEYTALAETLPEAAPAPIRVVLSVGTEVSFFYGRGPNRHKLEGKVVAVKLDGDKAVAYRLSSGEGFYEQLYTVQPGSIVEVGGDDAAQDDAPADNVNSVEGI